MSWHMALSYADTACSYTSAISLLTAAGTVADTQICSQTVLPVGQNCPGGWSSCDCKAACWSFACRGQGQAQPDSWTYRTQIISACFREVSQSLIKRQAYQEVLSLGRMLQLAVENSRVLLKPIRRYPRDGVPKALLALSVRH